MNKKDEALGMSRRSFLKNAAIVAAIPTGVTSLQASAANPSFIRVRRNAASNGWKYYRVKTVANDFPKTADEKGFVPSIYGGNLAVVRDGTGKFRTEKIDGRWWFIDPNGHPFLSAGVNSISPFSNENVRKLIADRGERNWSKDTVKELRSIGINTAGYWSKDAVVKGPSPHANMAYVYFDFSRSGDKLSRSGKRPQGLMETFAAGLSADPKKSPFFHSAFEIFCDDRCKTLSARKDDPWILGYFTDNELKVPSLQECLKTSGSNHAYSDLSAEALRWSVSYQEADGEADKQEQMWVAHCFNWYYSITTTAVRRYDPSHLLLGSRIFSNERNYPEVLAAAGRYLDVISLNPYGAPELSPLQLKQWSEWAGDKPVMIGEFYVMGHDVHLANRTGAGLTVATQSERGLYYQNYVINLLRSGCCVGWHWHRYSDSDKVSESRDACNKGLVDQNLNEYRELAAMIKEVNMRAHFVVDQFGK